MLVRLSWVIGCALATAGCCKGLGKPKGDAGASAAASVPRQATSSGDGTDEQPVAVGKFAQATLADFEKRAKKAKWNVKSSSTSDNRMDLELDDRSHYGYVVVIDVPPKVEKGQGTALAKMSDTKAIGLMLDVDKDRKLKAEDVLASILTKSPLESATRESLSAALRELKWKVGDTSKEDDDGLVTVRIDASLADGSGHLEVDLYEYAAAKKQGRIAIDGTRIMNVFVCRDCTKKEKRVTAEVWQTHKSRVLLGKLTNP